MHIALLRRVHQVFHKLLVNLFFAINPELNTFIGIG